MTRSLLNQVHEQLQTIWAEAGAWPDFVKAMSQSLHVNSSADEDSSNSFRWAFLPGLCCLAAGGDSGWADDLAAAWYLFYRAAYLMDSVQDKDEPDSWWFDLGPGYALSVASGLFFSASLALNNLYEKDPVKKKAPLVIKDFYQGLLVMSSGQHLDLLYHEPTLAQFWNIASTKSGSFFSLACKCGARLASDDPHRLEGYHKYGYHLGVLIQVLDDLEEWKLLRDYSEPSNLHKLGQSLPVIYAMEVYPPSMREHLRQCLRSSGHHQNDMDEVLQMINESGAVLYVETQIERHRAEALAGLSQAAPQSPAGEMLDALLNSINPN